ncbi:hypothetical protein CHS0354_012512 [Potamilus streckersoni]|uniref:Neurotransmitter-gated ion-channel transmembrane domain-containing protein n=1 Tax=Potamilus streckersoni TaxID=2493646 RepID=A0AAE0SW66_9BIVA|nr:hypothetical protein CHS0354_012512 [Potamilus streckersoni]
MQCPTKTVRIYTCYVVFIARLNGEWILDRTEIDYTDLPVTKSDGTIVTFSQIEFVFVIERRPAFYVINVILPIILASFLSCVVFIVPLQSGEKVAYILTLILAIAVLLTMIADSLPHTSLTASVLGVYLAFTLFISVICALLTVLLLNIFHKDEKLDTTSFIYKFTEFINVKRCTGSSKTKNANNPKTAGNRIVPSRKLTVVAYETMHARTDEKSENVDECKEKVYTRKEMANILDRFCFWVFVTLTFIGTISFLVALSMGAQKHHT